MFYHLHSHIIRLVFGTNHRFRKYFERKYFERYFAEFIVNGIFRMAKLQHKFHKNMTSQIGQIVEKYSKLFHILLMQHLVHYVIKYLI